MADPTEQMIGMVRASNLNMRFKVQETLNLLGNCAEAFEQILIIKNAEIERLKKELEELKSKSVDKKE